MWLELIWQGGCVFRKFFIDALGFEMYETIIGYVTSDFLEFELSGVSAIEGSRITNCWKERADQVITYKKKKRFEKFIEENFRRD